MESRNTEDVSEDDDKEEGDRDSLPLQQAETPRAAAITAVQKLKIVSAGVYHNLLLSVVALLLLGALPTLFSLAYHTADTGVTVLSVDGRVSPALARRRLCWQSGRA